MRSGRTGQRREPAPIIWEAQPRVAGCVLTRAYAPQMETQWGSRTLGSVLAAAEAASPVNAVEAVTRALGSALGALRVSFLIADLSGRALVRLAHVLLRTDEGIDIDTPIAPGERRAIEESATVV